MKPFDNVVEINPVVVEKQKKQKLSQITDFFGSRILEMAGRLEREVVFGPSWPL